MSTASTVLTKPVGKKRGPKGVEGLKTEIDRLKSEVAMLKPQVVKQESDFANRLAMEHNEKHLKLEIELQDLRTAHGQVQRKARQLGNDVAERDALLDSLRESHAEAMERAAHECAREHEKELNSKLRMIAHRDEKLVQARVRETEFAALQRRCAAAEAAEESHENLEGDVEQLTTLCADRLLTIKRLCGKLGGRPQVSRSEAELEQCTQ